MLFAPLVFVLARAAAASPGGPAVDEGSLTEVIDLTGDHQVPLKRRRLKIPLEKFDDPALETLTPTIEEWLETHRKENGDVKAKSKYYDNDGTFCWAPCTVQVSVLSPLSLPTLSPHFPLSLSLVSFDE